MERIADALADCLEAFFRGEAELQACCERYPEFKAELSTLLRVASSLPHLPQDVEPSPAWRRRTKAAILAKIEGEPESDQSSGG